MWIPSRNLLKFFVEVRTIPSRLPEKLAPRGLSEQRKSYLFKEIRKYCQKGTEDLVAPNPEKY